MITEFIRQAAKTVGIARVEILDSETDTKAQLARLTAEEDLPILIVSWDIEVSLSWNNNGFMNNPETSVTCLCLAKPEDKSKNTMQELSEDMGSLFTLFIDELRNILSPLTMDTPLTNVSYKLLPKHGITYHSGVIGKFTAKIEAPQIGCVMTPIPVPPLPANTGTFYVPFGETMVVELYVSSINPVYLRNNGTVYPLILDSINTITLTGDNELVEVLGESTVFRLTSLVYDVGITANNIAEFTVSNIYGYVTLSSSTVNPLFSIVIGNSYTAPISEIFLQSVFYVPNLDVTNARLTSDQVDTLLASLDSLNQNSSVLIDVRQTPPAYVSITGKVAAESLIAKGNTVLYDEQVAGNTEITVDTLPTFMAAISATSGSVTIDFGDGTVNDYVVSTNVNTPTLVIYSYASDFSGVITTPNTDILALLIVNKVTDIVISPLNEIIKLQLDVTSLGTGVLISNQTIEDVVFKYDDVPTGYTFILDTLPNLKQVVVNSVYGSGNVILTLPSLELINISLQYNDIDSNSDFIINLNQSNLSVINGVLGVSTGLDLNNSNLIDAITALETRGWVVTATNWP